jgi:hypothetical protein
LEATWWEKRVSNRRPPLAEAGWQFDNLELVHQPEGKKLVARRGEFRQY